MSTEIQSIIFGSGCFWCSDAIFCRLKGVESVTVGYAGGEKPNPSYHAVAGGNTGHTEVVRVEYYPDIISLDILLSVFFSTHDPTSLNRQGEDEGTQSPK